MARFPIRSGDGDDQRHRASQRLTVKSISPGAYSSLSCGRLRASFRLMSRRPTTAGGKRAERSSSGNPRLRRSMSPVPGRESRTLRPEPQLPIHRWIERFGPLKDCEVRIREHAVKGDETQPATPGEDAAFVYDRKAHYIFPDWRCGSKDEARAGS